MHPVRKQILTDESQQPPDVRIDDADWLVLEKWLGSLPPTGSSGTPPVSSPAPDISRFAGTLPLREDPLACQQGSMDEWADRGPGR